MSSCPLSLQHQSYQPIMTVEDEQQPMISEYKRRELAGELKPEMLLADNPHRYVIFPIQHADVSGLVVGFLLCLCL